MEVVVDPGRDAVAVRAEVTNSGVDEDVEKRLKLVRDPDGPGDVVEEVHRH